MGKRKKGYYKKSSQSKKGRYEQALQAGMKGFLITCGNKAEKDARREAYSILNEYADKLYGPEKNTKDDASDEDEEEEDIEKALEKEVEAMKKKKSTPRRFQAVDAGANNCVFIKTTVDNPAELLSHIIDDLHTTKAAKSRHIMKMFPVNASCKCDDDKIKKVALECFEKIFKDVGEFSYCCNFKIRNNTGMTRAKVLPIMCDVFTELDLKSTVEYHDPDYIVSVDIIKSVCCFSVMKDFSKYRKYNLQEIVAVEIKSGKTDEKAEENDKKESSENTNENKKTEGERENFSSLNAEIKENDKLKALTDDSELKKDDFQTVSDSTCKLNSECSSVTNVTRIDQVQGVTSDNVSGTNKVQGETSDNVSGTDKVQDETSNEQS